MSLKKNILANYASQIYVTLIGIIMVPLYVKYMGAEAYGLVGFFVMMQAWFQLLDMGLAPTLVRETARHHGGGVDALSYLRLVRALEIIFLIVALVGGMVIFFASSYISRNWLKASELGVDEVKTAVQLMAIIIAMRWMCCLYRSAISGSERLVWLGKFNSILATFRFAAVLLVLIFVGVTPSIFFSFQLVAEAIELSGLMFYSYHILPKLPQGQQLTLDWMSLKLKLKFSLAIAFTSSVWVLVTQTDKLVLSKILPLAEYGYFTLAVLVANGVMMISGPISSALLPRMSKLEAEGDNVGLIRLYRQATQFIAVLVGATSVTLAFCAEPLLWSWTGDKVLAHQTASVLTLYALGNGVLTLVAFPYYLQYAKGDLRLHLIGNAWFVVVLIPSIIIATKQYGGIGAGYVWLGLNLLIFVSWLPLVHRKFIPGLNFKWYVEDILYILLPVITVGYLLSIFIHVISSRWMQIAEISMMGIVLLVTGAFASSVIRAKVHGWLVFQKNIREARNGEKRL